MEYTRLGQIRSEGQPDRAGVHELRAGRRRGCTSGLWTRTPPRRSSGRRSSWVSRSGTPPTSIRAARRRSSSAARSDRYSRREDIVLATKVCGKMHDGPGGSGLSRKAILEQLDASLRRLGTDYIDVYYVHRFDDEAPVEETMAALHDVVKPGRSATSGASSMWAWQFAKMQHAAQLNGWTTFSAMQDQYNVLKREEERDMIPFCLDQGVGLTPYSPLAKGRATRPWGEQTARSSTDTVAAGIRSGRRQAGHRRRSRRSPTARGVPMARIALAWVLSKPVGVLPDRRGHQTPPPRRCRRSPRHHPHRRGDRSAGTAVHRPGQLSGGECLKIA